MFNINNRRYIGNKTKLMPWIKELIENNCKNCNSFCDIFAGTGSVTNEMINNYQTFYINDFLYSNEIIYKGFFLNQTYNVNKLNIIKKEYNNININMDNYVSLNYGNKYFHKITARKIGFIREDLENKYKNKEINEKEYSILSTSLLYSIDRIANTVGHYEAFIQKEIKEDNFVFELITPIDIKLLNNKSIYIYREDANEIIKNINADIIFIDPPYNSRQYSRFYHVLETIIKWDKPQLNGVAMKPKEENMSNYCRSTALKSFEDLIQKINGKYIVVTYNNTYNSKSKSSKNKIKLEEIKQCLEQKGKTLIFEQDYNAFNAGKTNLNEHKEYVFICEIQKKEE